MIDKNVVDILRCPVSGKSLKILNDHEIITIDNKYKYRIIDGIFVLLPPEAGSDAYVNKQVKEFYETIGWDKSVQGMYKDTEHFVDSRDIARNYTRACNLEICKDINRGGKYLLDAGCGAIPHKEYLEFHKNYQKRICIDFSFQALLEAKLKLGEKGIYIVADLTSIPIKDKIVDGAISLHVLYHIHEQQQHLAFEEIARVLKPDAKAVVVYRWDYSPIAWRLSRLFKMLTSLFGSTKLPNVHLEDKEDTVALYFYPHSLEWFLNRKWTFEYRIKSFRLIDNFMMKTYFDSKIMWKAVVGFLLALQHIFPTFTGKYGLYPKIVINGNK